ncbi:hypothetical protein LTR78_007371 [Recurvomyces mirabilis]|uniref:Uncharacterized protein n=1 Tax=Recurvomyces mirabilis TaxID=574656 RepID=A0AAE0WJD5_9PEZI|nr:hypothetical protein LTR78_007371 [Recurvomyces mirabilis]KAK5155041.1 hypothetical protein LTS14_005996 [Recurvomyces mirabilis]
MDARAYLQSQGWQGDGHSLDHTGRGIKKPLLVSKKVDVLGVGVNKHQAVSDQWWLRAYDQGLTDFGTGKQSLLGQVQKHGIAMGGLYGRFVKGEGVAGTFGESLSSTPAGTITPSEIEQHVSGKDGRSAVDMASATLKRKREHVRSVDKRAKQRTKEDSKSDDRVKRLVGKAQRRGLLPSKSREPIATERARSDVKGDLAKIMATLSASSKFQVDINLAAVGNDTAKKRARSAAKHEFRRVARAHLGTASEDASTRRARKEQEGASEAKRDVDKASRTARNLASMQARREGKNARRLQRAQSQDNPSTVNDMADGAISLSPDVVVVVDTQGDDALANTATNGSSSPAAATIQEGDYATARSHIASQTPFSFVNTRGKQIFERTPGDRVPEDPKWWADTDTKALPKPVREARRRWRSAQREDRHGSSRNAAESKKVETDSDETKAARVARRAQKDAKEAKQVEKERKRQARKTKSSA